MEPGYQARRRIGKGGNYSYVLRIPRRLLEGLFQDGYEGDVVLRREDGRLIIEPVKK